MNPLALSEEAYRQIFERISQLALDYLAGIGERSCFPNMSAVEARNLFDGPVPEQGMGAAALDDLTKVIAASRAQGPRFFGYVLGSGEPVAAGRPCIVNHRTTAADVDAVIDEVLKVGKEWSSGAQS